uniref:J domain-containing protein n=1 Tax=Steinernema glaseri TaxID=37863 RepID=A0A1I7YUS6_9BILA
MNVIALALGLFALIEAVQCVGLAPGLYCGLEICYDVLGLDRETFRKSELAKTYRKLAKKFHPDRVKNEEDKAIAEERFRLVATAYETLKDDETRGFYDYYLDHPEERYYNYYQYYRMRATPKVDVRLVVIGVVSVISLIQYLSAKNKYSEAIDYAVKVAKYRNAAIDIAKDRGLIDVDPKTGKIRKNKKSKEAVDIEAIVRAIVEENMDVRGGYKKESIYDTFAWHIVSFPLTLFRYVVWKVRWIKKYNVNGEEYDEDDKMYLIRKNLGMTECQFACLEPNEIDEFFDEKLWLTEKFQQWKEAKELEEREKLANSGRYKRYRRYMKSNAGNTMSFVE